MKSRIGPLTLMGCSALCLLSACAGGDRICRDPGYTCEDECTGDDCTPTAYPHKPSDSGDHAGSIDDGGSH